MRGVRLNRAGFKISALDLFKAKNPIAYFVRDSTLDFHPGQILCLTINLDEAKATDSSFC